MYEGKYKFVALVPAHDWFFVPRHAGESYVALKRIAAWGTTDKGLTVGLVAFGADPGMGVPARLEGVGNEPGTYKHLNELTQLESQALTKR